MSGWKTFRKRKRARPGNFNPDSEYCSHAINEYRAQGGQITVLPSPPAVFETNDFNIEDEATENVNLRGIYD